MHRAPLATLAAALLAAATPAAAVSAPHYPEAPERPMPAPQAIVVIPPLHLAAADDARAQADAWKQWSEHFSQEMRSSMGTLFAGRMGSGKVVKGAPYSAEVVTETNQTLADGNIITKRTTGAVYRDGEGRTRQDSSVPGKERSVFIGDPVAGTSIVLSPDTKRATVTPGPRAVTVNTKNKQVVSLDGTEVRVEDGKVFVNGREVGSGSYVKSFSGKEVTIGNGKIIIDGDGKVIIDGNEVGAGPGSSSQVIVKQVDGGDGTSREEVRVQVVRSGDGHVIPMPPIPPMPPGALSAPLAPLPPMPGLNTLRFESVGKLGKGVALNLGTKDFNGVKAEGKSTTWTIPAGEIGNRAPIQIVSESWYAPELQVTVYSRYNDPRTGESLYRLAGIRRGEPAPALFTVPADYQVRDRAKERERAREDRDRAREERKVERRNPG